MAEQPGEGGGGGGWEQGWGAQQRGGGSDGEGWGLSGAGLSPFLRAAEGPCATAGVCVPHTPVPPREEVEPQLL